MGSTHQHNRSSQEKNQGEGNREAARAYNQDQQRFVKAGKVDEAARDAERATQGHEKDELRRAEQKGKSHAAEHDPQEKRTFNRPS